MGKKLNYTCQEFNPLEHLVQSKTASGEPAYEPYVKNGVVVIENNHIVYVPKVHLDSNALRDWFHKIYPEGRMEVIDHSADPVYNSEKGFIYPIEKFEVRLYENRSDVNYKANGFGTCEPVEKGQYSPTSSAISYAIINAMRNMGAGVDINFSDLMDELPKFMEIEGPLTTEGLESYYTPFTSGIYAEPKEKAVTEPASEQIGNDEPKLKEPKVKTEKPDADAGKKMTPLDYLKSREEKPVPVNKETPSEPAPGPAVKKSGLEAYAAMTIEEAGEVVFETEPGYEGNLKDFIGKKMAALLVKKPRIIRMFCGTNGKEFPWEGKITPQTYKAALVLGATIK